MNQTHSRSRTELDHNYQGGLRGSKKKQRSIFWMCFRGLRFILLWGSLAGASYLYYQERLWNSALENQQSGYMQLIQKLVTDSSELDKTQKSGLMDALKKNKIKRCYILRPVISIPCS